MAFIDCSGSRGSRGPEMSRSSLVSLAWWELKGKKVPLLTKKKEKKCLNICLCLHECDVCGYTIVLSCMWKSEDNLVELFFSYLSIGSGGQAEPPPNPIDFIRFQVF